MHYHLKTGQRKRIRSVEHMNAFSIPSTSSQKCAGRIRGGILAAKQSIVNGHRLAIHAVFDPKQHVSHVLNSVPARVRNPLPGTQVL